MRNRENPKDYQRSSPADPTGLTDAELALVRSHVDVPQVGFGRRRWGDLRELVNAVFYIPETGSQLHAYRAIWPRTKPSKITSSSGNATGRSVVSTMISTSRPEKRLAGKPAPPSLSSAVGA